MAVITAATVATAAMEVAGRKSPALGTTVDTAGAPRLRAEQGYRQIAAEISFKTRRARFVSSATRLIKELRRRHGKRPLNPFVHQRAAGSVPAFPGVGLVLSSQGRR